MQPPNSPPEVPKPSTNETQTGGVELQRATPRANDSTSPSTSHNQPPPLSPAPPPVQAADPVPAQASAVPPPPPAADVDLIEKAWVEKADQIIEQHSNDPYQEEEKAEELSQAYLKQRFGIDVDKPDQKK